MSNKPNFRASVSLAEFVDRRREEGSITIQIPDGEPVVVPPAELWPAEASTLSSKRRTGKASLEAVWRAVIGAEAFDRFAVAAKAAAGDVNVAVLLDNIVQEAITSKQGATPGE